MKKYILTLLWIIGIIFPMAWLTNFNSSFNEWFSSTFQPEWMHVVMHSMLYFVLSLLILFGQFYKTRQFFLTLAIILIIGIIQELFQLTAGVLLGWGTLFDLAVDLFGGLFGWLIYQTITRFLLNRNEE